MSPHAESNKDACKSHSSFISIDEFHTSFAHQVEDVQANERADSSSDGVCVNKPIVFRRIPRQVSLRRYNFLCSDRQIAMDTSKPCCGNLCLTKFGKANLRGLRQKYLSLNGEEQDTCMLSHMQLVQDHTARSSSMQVEYYLTLSMKSCRVAFKIAYSVGNMRLERIQHRLVKGSWVSFQQQSVYMQGFSWVPCCYVDGEIFL